MGGFSSLASDRTYKCRFAPDDPGCPFLVLFHPPTPDQRRKMADKAGRAGGGVSLVAFAEQVTRRIKGWSGLTPREAERLGLLPGETAESIAAQFGGDPDKEIVYTSTRAQELMDVSARFSERMSELLELDVARAAEEALAKND